MLVGSLHEDFGKKLGSWTHVDSILTRTLVLWTVYQPPQMCA